MTSSGKRPTPGKMELFVVERQDGEWLDSYGNGGFSVYTDRSEAQDALDSEADSGRPDDTYEIVTFARAPELASTVESQAAQLKKAMRALESLTPGGSEYVGDVERCLAAVRDSRRTTMEAMQKWAKRARDAEATVEAQRERIRVLEEALRTISGIGGVAGELARNALGE